VLNQLLQRILVYFEVEYVRVFLVLKLFLVTFQNKECYILYFTKDVENFSLDFRLSKNSRSTLSASKVVL